MASTYSPTLRIELIGNGEQAGTWGTTTNTNLGSLLEQAITGVQTITMGDSTYTLTAFDGAVDEARNAVLVLGGVVTSPQNLIAPSVEKVYIVNNGTGSNVTIKTSGGSGILVQNNSTVQVYCDGTNFFSATPNINSITGNLTVSGNGDFGGNVSVTGNVAVTGNETVAGNLSVTGSISAGSITGITGRIVQIQQQLFTGATFSGSTIFTSTGHELTITPTSASSKILILNNAVMAQQAFSNGEINTMLFRNNSVNLAGSGRNMQNVGGSGGSPQWANGGICYLDSPNTTSATTYSIYMAGPAATAFYNGSGVFNSTAMLVAMEISQ
jgi:cytoskeletal protein CcmA (bactofilin family)